MLLRSLNVSMQHELPKGAQAPREAMLQTNSSLKLSRWLHAYGELLRCGSMLTSFRIPSEYPARAILWPAMWQFGLAGFVWHLASDAWFPQCDSGWQKIIALDKATCHGVSQEVAVTCAVACSQRPLCTRASASCLRCTWCTYSQPLLMSASQILSATPRLR